MTIIAQIVTDLKGLSRGESLRLAWYAAIILTNLTTLFFAWAWWSPTLTEILRSPGKW